MALEEGAGGAGGHAQRGTAVLRVKGVLGTHRTCADVRNTTHKVRDKIGYRKSKWWIRGGGLTDNHLLLQSKNTFSTHIVHGVDVRACHQQSLYHLRMPMERRQVKWGDLALSGERVGNDDTQIEKKEREDGQGCWSWDINTYILNHFPASRRNH